MTAKKTAAKPAKKATRKRSAKRAAKATPAGPTANPLAYTWRWLGARWPGTLGPPRWLATIANCCLWVAVGAALMVLLSRIDLSDVVPLPDVAEFPKLAGEVRSITCRLHLDPPPGQLDAMAAAIRSACDGNAAETVDDLTGRVSRSLSSEISGDRDAWIDWGNFIETELIKRHRSGRLLTPDDYRVALQAVATGLVNAKDCP